MLNSISKKLPALTSVSVATAVASMGSLVLSTSAKVAVSRTVLTVGRFAIVSPFAKVAVVGGATALSPLVTSLVAGTVVYIAVDRLVKHYA
jgi:hypothetical protein